MWSYYGAKTSIIKHYPKPKHDVIIETFAGTARYALLHWEKEVILVDKHEVIVDIWHFLQQCSPKDILSLPTFKPGQKVDDYTYDCKAQRDLVGFIVGYGLTHPANHASKALHFRPNRILFTLQRIAADIHKIKHWKISTGSYDEIPNQLATYFIDPPYFIGGHKYVHGSKNIDYEKLAEFCRTRNGQVIVCENMKATWLPFNPLKMLRGAQGNSMEGIWTNEPTIFNNIQQLLF